MVYRSNLEIPAARPLRGDERERVLRRATTRATTVMALAQRAGIRCRVTGGPQAHVVLWNGPGHGHTVDDEQRVVYAINRTGLPQRDPERAARILEILAYGCFDYAARESVCGRGIFVFPLQPDHGRAWLAEIGRRGGGVRTPAKAAASRTNGAQHNGYRLNAGPQRDRPNLA